MRRDFYHTRPGYAQYPIAGRCKEKESKKKKKKYKFGCRGYIKNKKKKKT